ncbi:ferric reductase-like transmembrane domain-containing protein [Micromonospora sp. NPDC000442]|uniref:ferric reductase-like transmembrane domain-containing protein n=1 Tax=Micromonospora sp. NPDC000442 TaxID=3364217 RepID=UPI0036BC7935
MGRCANRGRTGGRAGRSTVLQKFLRQSAGVAIDVLANLLANLLAKQMPVLLGMIAAVLIGIMAFTSVRIARRRMSYETWHAIHLVV